MPASHFPSTSSAEPIENSDAEAAARGTIFTRPEVVAFMLELIGYTPECDLTQTRLLEPSFGDGAFFLPVIDSLLESWQRFHPDNDPVDLLGPCLLGVELHAATAWLKDAGVALQSAKALTKRWLVSADFLTFPLAGTYRLAHSTR